MPKHLVKQHNTWFYQRRVPKRLKHLPQFQNKTIIKFTLQTDSLNDALKLRDKHDAALEAASRNDIHAKSELVYQNMVENYGHPLGKMFDEQVLYVVDLERDRVLEKHAKGLGVDEDSLYSDPEFLGINRYLDELSGREVSVSASLYSALKETLETNPKKSSDKTLRGYERTVGKFLSVFGLEDVELDSLSVRYVQDFIQYRRDQSATDKTIKNEIGQLSTVFKAAKRKGWVKVDNPFLEPELSSRATQPREPFNLSEVNAVLERLKPQYKLLWKILYYTGVRVDEVMAFNDSSIVDKESEKGFVKCFYIPKGKTVNAVRYIPVHPELKKDLEGFSGFKVSRSRFNADRKKIVTELYGEDFARSHVSHSLRHTFSTTLHNHFPEVPQLVDWLTGHSGRIKSESFQTYFHGYGLDRLYGAVCKVPCLN